MQRARPNRSAAEPCCAECRYDRSRGRTRQLAVASVVDRPRRSGRRDTRGRAADRCDSQPRVRPPRRRDVVVVPGAGRHRSPRRIAGGHLRARRRTAATKSSTHPARRAAWVGCCRSSPSGARPATSWRWSPSDRPARSTGSPRRNRSWRCCRSCCWAGRCGHGCAAQRSVELLRDLVTRATWWP